MKVLSLRSLGFLLFLLPLTWFRSVSAQPAYDPAAKAAVVAPFLDEQTLVVARIDLTKLDPIAAVKLVADSLPDEGLKTDPQLASLGQQGKARLQAMTQAGVREVYVVVSLTDFPKEPVFVIAPVATGQDAQKAAEALRDTLHFQAADVRPGVVVLGTTAIVERLKNLRPAARPEFAKGFERAGDTAVQVIFSPSDDTRRVLQEMLPRLPDQFGGISGKMLVDGMQWGVLSVNGPPKLSLDLLLQSKDADAAAILRGAVQTAVQTLRQQGTRPAASELERRGADAFVRLITPQLKGDQLVLSHVQDEQDVKILLQALVPAVQGARTAAGRSQSMNCLKQIGLAMHNYHDQYKHFPPQAIRSKEGKPLLSWRVAILPFVEQGQLYQQFHLDEPWDSEHNKKLIEKMPATFASPHLGDALKMKGMTSYLVPLTRQPPAVFTPPKPAAPGSAPAPAAATPEMTFDNPEGTSFQKITDGTSNTAIVVEAHPKSAVTWTKPEDLVIDAKDPFQGLRDQPNNGFAALFGDGSVRMIFYTLDPKVLTYIFQMNDGQAHGF